MQLKSTVKAVLVLFCQDGVAFLKQLYSGLDKVGSLERVLIVMDEGQVDNDVKQYDNVTVEKDPESALGKLKQLIQQSKGAMVTKKALTKEQQEDFQKEFEEVPKKKKRGKAKKA